MDDWIAREGLPTIRRERLRALSAKSDLRGAVQAASHLGALATTTAGLIWVAPAAPLAYAPLFFTQGVLINCLYAGQHELSHWTAFRTKALNDVFGHLFGFLTLNPFLSDRWLHFAHHRATHDPQRDPEIMGMGAYTLTSYALDLAGVSFWWRRVRGIVRAAAGRGLEDAYWLDAAGKRIVVREARVHVVLWVAIAAACVAAQSWAALALWIAPMLATKWFHQLQNTGEHTGLPHVADIFANTRTLKGPAPMRWLMWNMTWHTAHHCFPGVPFHALPALTGEIEAGLGRPLPRCGYLEAQRDIFAGLIPRSGGAGDQPLSGEGRSIE
ncbi:MAG TPA: fatty acid desaturase [Caulobacteraceae bacterium]|nr:fatty acid desaturase [Caulobacteraceae bacterium]